MKEPEYQKLADWAEIVVDGVPYRWSAQRLVVMKRLPDGRRNRRHMVQIQIGFVNEPTIGVLHPDGTEPTEDVVTRAIRRYGDELRRM